MIDNGPLYGSPFIALAMSAWATVTSQFPSFIRQAGQSIVAFLVNNALGYYGGDIYNLAYGVVNRLIRRRELCLSYSICPASSSSSILLS